MSGVGGKLIGIGADPTKSTIDWWCWDQSGFKDCHAKQWEAARDYCRQTNSEGYTSMDVCLNKETDFRAKANCKCSKKPPKEGGLLGGAGMGTYFLGAGIIAVLAVLIYRDQKR